jgi:hypothetical protein
MKYYAEFCKNLMAGISYYRNLPKSAIMERDAFEKALNNAEQIMNDFSRLFSIPG